MNLSLFSIEDIAKIYKIYFYLQYNWSLNFKYIECWYVNKVNFITFFMMEGLK